MHSLALADLVLEILSLYGNEAWTRSTSWKVAHLGLASSCSLTCIMILQDAECRVTQLADLEESALCSISLACPMVVCRRGLGGPSLCSFDARQQPHTACHLHPVRNYSHYQKMQVVEYTLQ